jgi:cytochrome b6-f complex iron-sulfur subunit
LNDNEDMTYEIHSASATPATRDQHDTTTCTGCGPSRRTFLGRGAVLGAVGVASSVGLTACTDDIRAENSAPSQHLGGTPTPVIAVGDLPVGEQASVAVDGRTLLLNRESEDTVKAFSAACTHQGCTVAPGQDQGRPTFACPCHGSHFDVATGAPYGGPAKKPLTEFTATVEGDSVMVTL